MPNPSDIPGERYLIAYYRVSTQIQGIAGLGMVAQRRSVEAYALEQRCTIIASYAEVETGRKQTLRNRPELVKAIAHARRSGAILAIARLDRLARNLYVTAQLLESGVDFVACDNPHASRLTIQILAAMAEHEGRLISERCKATSDALKARGVTFGRAKGYRVPPEDAKRFALMSGASRRAHTLEAYADLVPTIIRLRYAPTSLAGIARHLNELGHCSQQKRPLSADIIREVLRRAGFAKLTARPADLYGPKGLVEARGMWAVMREKLDAKCYAAIEPIVTRMRAQPEAYESIAQHLNKLGYRTQYGHLWGTGNLRRFLDRRGYPESRAERELVQRILAPKACTAAAKARRDREPGLMRLARLALKRRGTWAALAEKLNARGFRTQRGTLWTAPSAQALVERERCRRSAAAQRTTS